MYLDLTTTDTVFIFADAHFKQRLVWLRMHSCVTVSAL